jgi:hypothetical protein
MKQRDAAARYWNLVIVLVIAAAVGVQLVLVLQGKNVLTDAHGRIPAVSTRVIRFLSYFTIESNLLCLFTAATLVADPGRDGRVWRVLRVDALVGITVTGLIYVTLLRPVVNLHGVSKLTDIGMHYASPLLVVIGWLLFGPRPRIDRSVLLPSLAWPALYVGYTIAHGAATKWYPYPFVDVVTLGYRVTLRNGVGICVLLLGISVLFLLADDWLSRPRSRAGAAVRPSDSGATVRPPETGAAAPR